MIISVDICLVISMLQRAFPNDTVELCLVQNGEKCSLRFIVNHHHVVEVELPLVGPLSTELSLYSWVLNKIEGFDK